MVVAKSLAVSLRGLEGTVVEVETEIAKGLPAFKIVGLPDSSTLQAKERVRGACSHCGYGINEKKVTVNLTPAWLPKQGSAFDVAIAMSALASLGQVDAKQIQGVVFIGELTLDGYVRPVPGVLPSVLAALKSGIEQIVVPAGNESEAKLVSGAKIIAIEHLIEAIRIYGGRPKQIDLKEQSAEDAVPIEDSKINERLDFDQVKGQYSAVMAATVAAAGGHHLLMIGAPGSGKTMIAARIPTILPPLDEETALTLTAINSINARLSHSGKLWDQAPFIAPHHSASWAAIIGGGTSLASPGAISLAHGGILFLDEAPEFPKSVLESLRQPLEKGEISLHRSRGVTTYPARFQLVMAANPCPCAKAFAKGKNCTCSSLEIRRYRAKLSAPILDRIDIRVQVNPAKVHLDSGALGESSKTLKNQVMQARLRQQQRLKNTVWKLNAELPGSFLDEKMPLPISEERYLLRLVDKHEITMRGRDRIRRLAWTLADLAGKSQPGEDEVAKALMLRGENIL